MFKHWLHTSGEPVSEKDLFVGAVLTIHQRAFQLLEADDFTYTFMENNCHSFVMADLEAALHAIAVQIAGNATGA